MIRLVFIIIILISNSSVVYGDIKDKFELYYFEDFSNKKFKYELPHKHNTSSKAKKINLSSI